jgi:hypothetical protein
MLRRLVSRRLLWALAASLLVHLWMVAGAEFGLPDWSVEQDRIEVTLAPPPSPKLPPRAADKPEPPKAKPVPAKRIPPPPPPIVPAPLPATSATPPMVETPPVGEVPMPVTEEVAPVVAEEEPAPVVAPPKRVEIEFAGFNGGKGKGKQVFELLPDGHYKLSAEMSMPVMLFISGSIEQSSEGLVTSSGLQPVAFRQKTTGSKPQQASFDWAANRVTLDTGKRTDVLDLPPGTQDFLSFIYQFMFVPPLEQMRINIVTGKKLKTYVYEFEGEESLQTKMGALRTWHIGRSSADGDEKTEIWLAVEYRYLPVRIRKTEKDGSAIDLVATRLNITE